MVPKVVTDAGYTVVGLGVLAVQQVQTRHRETRSRVSDQIQASRHGLESAIGQVKARLEPLQAKLEPLQAKLEPLKARLEAPVSAALGRLPQLPGSLGGLLVPGRNRTPTAPRPEADDPPPARSSARGKATAAPSSTATSTATD
jgi:hypothetical protein